jgi:Ricin-type beta-trefoil lectin domain-like
MGRTTNGANVGRWSATNSTNQQWIIENSGNYVRIRNRATGLYLDGSTSNGADAAQYADSGSTNQQWTIIAA